MNPLLCQRKNKGETQSVCYLFSSTNPIFKDLAVPAGLYCETKTVNNNNLIHEINNNDIVNNDLYDKLIELVRIKTKKNNKTKQRKKKPKSKRCTHRKKM